MLGETLVLRSENSSLMMKVPKRISDLQGMKILRKEKESTKIEAGPTFDP